MSTVQCIETVYVPVSNVERSAAWYHRFLDLAVYCKDRRWKYYQLTVPTGEDQPTHPTITLCERPEVQPLSQPIFSLLTANARVKRADLLNHGQPVTDLAQDDQRVFFSVLDPDGNSVSIASHLAANQSRNC